MLYRSKPNSIERALMLTLAALILFVVANSFPFLTFELEAQTSLKRAALNLRNATTAAAAIARRVIAVRPADRAEPGTRVEVEVFGDGIGGAVAAEPLYDAEGARVRS